MFSFLSATFDRIAEINFNLDADDNSVSVFQVFVCVIINQINHINVTATTFAIVKSFGDCRIDSFTYLSVHRPMRLLLKPAVKRGYASSMMLKKKRTFGRRRR